MCVLIGVWALVIMAAVAMDAYARKQVNQLYDQNQERRKKLTKQQREWEDMDHE